MWGKLAENRAGRQAAILGAYSAGRNPMWLAVFRPKAIWECGPALARDLRFWTKRQVVEFTKADQPNITNNFGMHGIMSTSPEIHRGQWLPDGNIKLSLLPSAFFIFHGACRAGFVLALFADRP